MAEINRRQEVQIPVHHEDTDEKQDDIPTWRPNKEPKVVPLPPSLDQTIYYPPPPAQEEAVEIPGSEKDDSQREFVLNEIELFYKNIERSSLRLQEGNSVVAETIKQLAKNLKQGLDNSTITPEDAMKGFANEESSILGQVPAAHDIKKDLVGYLKAFIETYSPTHH